MAETLNVTIHMTGLIAYALKQGQIDAIAPADACICETLQEHGGDGPHGAVAHAEGAVSHLAPGDAHRPVLVIPLTAADKGSSAPDAVFNHGMEELGLWRLEDTVLEVLRDGQVPQPALHYSRSRDLPHPPTDANEGDLFWLPEIQRALNIPHAEFRPECFPPAPDPGLVSTVVRLLEGKAVALWSDDRHKQELWQFDLPVQGSKVRFPVYTQAFADGIQWSFDCTDHVEIRLRSLSGDSGRSVYIPFDNPDVTSIAGAITNKPSTVGGLSVLEADALPDHFSALYALMRPSAGRLSRRLLRRAHAQTSTTTNRCPGGSGG